MKFRVSLIFALTIAQAHGADPVNVRFGSHQGFDRIVFEFPAPTTYTMDRTADAAILHFADAGRVPDLSAESKIVRAIKGGDATATISLVPGAEMQAMQLDRRIVLDVRRPSSQAAALAPVSGKAHTVQTAKGVIRSITPAKPSPPQPEDAPKPSTRALLTPATPVWPKESAQGPIIPVAQPAPVSTVAQTTEIVSQQDQPNSTVASVSAEPISIAATPIDTPSGSASTAVLLPFSQDVGAAAFRHGSEAWVVFDEPRPVEAASLKDYPAFAGAVVQVLPAGTLLRLQLPEDQAIGLRRVDSGWIITVGPPAGPGFSPLLPFVQADRLIFPAADTGHIVAIDDSETGGNLQVGTLRAAGPGVPVPYRVPGFNILPSWQGVVAELLSDRTAARNIPEGIAIETNGPLSPSPDSARALADAAILTRRFDFPALPVPSLLHRLQAQMADDGAAPPRDRLSPRKAVAQTMLALGLGPEAESLLRLAEAEDPRASEDPDVQGLIGIAALLSGRPAEANGLLNAGLDGSDEIALWRAVLAATRQEGSPEAASLFSATTKLILSYPSALRDRLLPLAAETMASGGAAPAADALLAKLTDEPRLALARAIRLEAKGDVSGALTILQTLAMGRDRWMSARAATRSVRLQLASHAIKPAEAADDLERGFLNWRGDTRERDLRLEVVDLRAQAGQWRRAFSLLKETAALYPDDVPMFQDRTTRLLTALLQGGDATPISPLDLVTLAEENAEEAAKAAPDKVTALLANRLMALDLPKQAAPVIERMMATAPTGIGRATLGARLASIRLTEGDLTKAEAALDGSTASDLPSALVEQRGLIAARLRAQQHDIPAASAILADLDTAAADDLRATILADAGDWRGAEAALKSLASRSVPVAGPLSSEQQDVLLRLASAQTRAGDDEEARVLGIQEAGRMVGPRSGMFRLLTAMPVSGLGDLQRSAGELAMARTIPAGLAAIGNR